MCTNMTKINKPVLNEGILEVHRISNRGRKIV